VNNQNQRNPDQKQQGGGDQAHRQQQQEDRGANRQNPGNPGGKPSDADTPRRGQPQTDDPNRRDRRE
jgi:hypothetical protein